MSALFDPPRWKNGPQICVATNLPAFESSEALTRFLAVNSPATTIIHKWECQACGQWHVWCYAVCPAGASSGTTRIQKHADEFAERFWKSPLARTVKRKIEFA